MGEIKSTLDLVMERTRHLSMSAEERNRQKRTDYEKRLKGLLQRYEDGGLSVAAVKEQTAALAAELTVSGRELAAGALADRIDPDQDNGRRLDLLAELAPDRVDPFNKLLASYREKRASLRRAAEKRVSADLFRDYGIEGSAVVPNPENDPDYREALAALRKETRAAMDAISADPMEKE